MQKIFGKSLLNMENDYKLILENDFMPSCPNCNQETSLPIENLLCDNCAREKAMNEIRCSCFNIFKKRQCVPSCQCACHRP